MKKMLTFFGEIGMIASTSAVAVSCTTKERTPEQDFKIINAFGERLEKLIESVEKKEKKKRSKIKSSKLSSFNEFIEKFKKPIQILLKQQNLKMN
ncbi:lipoprotein [Mycoplasma putrefaciens]|uniref:Lipoprotein n=1 Tax=Mycoplasma putrefaciens (strain ATCC 15718 / NCTC 10155 / C30 KS-1 / KS-1) TaxID=743965 RepID=A0A7U3ZRY6_MYCPK|nr:lipoprotein [Mycoplasma putrefaciens]AEM68422.1 lipoprotein [Mycoplasma putrefaciens KS1]SYV94734.1 lipoprotein [Mycoplasma putrefaciens]